jgi:hypothetical protein
MVGLDVTMLAMSQARAGMALGHLYRALVGLEVIHFGAFLIAVACLWRTKSCGETAPNLWRLSDQSRHAYCCVSPGRNVRSLGNADPAVTLTRGPAPLCGMWHSISVWNDYPAARGHSRVSWGAYGGWLSPAFLTAWALQGPSIDSRDPTRVH